MAQYQGAGAQPGLGRLRAFLLDMDGTLYVGARPLPAAAEFIDYLRASGRRLLFFTNNPTRDAAAYADKLAGMGIRANPAEVLTSGEATVRYLVEETPYRRAYIVGTPGFVEECRRAGIHASGEDAEAVVLAFDTTLTYAKLETACRLIRAGRPYFATNPDRVCPAERGPIPDCGAMAALLYEAAGRWPKFIGKPEVEMAARGMAKLGASREETAMVGDRLYTDMRMAYNAGIASILVLSGETQAGDIKGLDRRPAYVFPSVRELREALEEADAANPR